MLLQKLSQKTFKYMCHLCELISLVIITQLTKDIFIVLCVCMLFVSVFFFFEIISCYPSLGDMKLTQ